MDSIENRHGIYSQKELIETGKKLIAEGNKKYINAKIDPEKMNIMLLKYCYSHQEQHLNQK